jgi:hypothetical protein
MKTFILAITLIIASSVAIASPADATTYGGDATGAEVTVTATGTTIRANTGTLAIAGGMADAALAVGDIPGSATGGVVTLTASALHSSVIGGRGVTRAEASMGAMGLTVSGNSFSADFLMARSTASCDSGPVLAGNSEITNLVINGTAITVSGSPNQTVSLPNGTAIINAHVSSVNGTAGELAVTALRVMTHDTITQQPIADVLLTTVDAKIDCQGSSSSAEEWATGGGWIVGQPNSGMATFGFIAGKTDPETAEVKGHLTYKDHAANVTVHGNAIAQFTACELNESPHVSVFTGSDTNGNTFTVKVDDNGEPGGGSDTFSIEVTDQNSQVIYANSRPLSAGNIQAHGFTCN